MGENVLIIYAHHDKQSFNAALLDVAVKQLEDQGHSVVISDLYAMNFNPVIGRHDIKGSLKNPTNFNYSEETAAAWEEGRIAEDIKLEQDKISRADLLIFQFPLHWMGMPAIMKGWCDRIFVPNYAFSETQVYDQAMMKGKKAVLSITTGAPEHFYTCYGPNGDVNVLLWPLQNGILRLTGFDVLAPQISFSPGLHNAETRANQLTSWQDRIMDIFDEDPLYFIPISKFKVKDPADPLKGMTLTQESIEEEEFDPEWGLTIGQHLDRRLSKDTMLKPRPPRNLMQRRMSSFI